MFAGFVWRIWLAQATFLNADEAWHFAVANRTSLSAAYNASLTLAHPPLPQGTPAEGVRGSWRAAAEPGARLDAGQATAPGGGLDARYEQLRHAALHARGEAFPLGLGVLAAKGLIAWRRALASLVPAARTTPAGPPAPGGPAPGLAAELISAMAAVAHAAAGGAPP